jgi:hypothetical protein
MAGNIGQFQPKPPTPPPATIAASGNWNSGIMSNGGYGSLAVAAKLSQTGTLVLQRYLDPAGTIPIGAAISQAMTANTVATVATTDGLLCSAFSIVVTNTGGSTGNLSSVFILAGNVQ